MTILEENLAIEAKRVLREAQRVHRSVVDDVTVLAQIPAPTFAEEERLRWIEDRLAADYGSVQRDQVGNVVWTSDPGTPTLLFLAHVDTVFDLSTELRVQRREGWLTGPGIGDNACAVAVMLKVIEESRHLPRRTPWGVAFTVGEEGHGNLRGACAACEALRPQTVIAVEGHLLDEVITDAVGSIRAVLEVRGPGGHSWMDRGTPSAIDGLLEILDALHDRNDLEVLNIGLIEGGRAINAIADAASARIEGRSLEEGRIERLADHLHTLSVAEPLEVTVEIVGRRPSGRLEPTADLAQSVLRVRRALGLSGALSNGSTDANAALAMGLPALTLGCARGKRMHTLDESIEIESIVLGYAQLKLTLEALCP